MSRQLHISPDIDPMQHAIDVQSSDLGLSNPRESNAPEREWLIIKTLDHRSAPVSIRELVSIHDEQLPQAYQNLRQIDGVREGVIISTCNRTEIVVAGSVVPGGESGEIVFPHRFRYAAEAQSLTGRFSIESLSCPSDIIGALDDFFERLVPTREINERQIIRERLESFSGGAAVDRLFRVAAGLESMVLGEPEIVGQLKSSYRNAVKHGSIGPTLHRLFERAFRVAKLVRTHTGISRCAVSLGYAIREIVAHTFSGQQKCRVAILGAGDFGLLVARHLTSLENVEIIIANRTFSRAKTLAEEVGADICTWDEVPSLLPKTDVVIGTLALSGKSPPVVSRALIQECQQLKTGNSPQLYFDLGVPRNFEWPSDLECQEERPLESSALRSARPSGLSLFTLDHLEAFCRRNHSARLLEVKRAESYVEEEAQSFLRWLSSREQARGIGQLHRYFSQAVVEEVTRTLKKAVEVRSRGGDGGGGEQRGFAENAIEILAQSCSQAVVKKLLARAIETIKNEGQLPPQSWLTTCEELFLGPEG